MNKWSKRGNNAQIFDLRKCRSKAQWDNISPILGWRNKEDQAKTTDWKDVEKLVSSISVQGIMRHGDIRVDGGFLGLGQDGIMRVFHTT